MADDNSAPEAEGEDGVPSLFDQPEGVDWFLANQIHMADAYNVEQGITLSVGGVLVTGTLISGRAYFKELGELTRSATKGTAREEIGRVLGDAHQQWTKIYPERKDDEEYPYRPTNYIHLRNASMIGSNGHMSGPKGALWRGKLASVDGYFFGNLTVG